MLEQESYLTFHICRRSESSTALVSACNAARWMLFLIVLGHVVGMNCARRNRSLGERNQSYPKNGANFACPNKPLEFLVAVCNNRTT